MLHCPTCGRRYEGGETVCPEDGAALRADQTVAESVPKDPLVGRVLDDKYRLEARLGEGGMGTVYRATHLLIDRGVAVKVLHPRFVEDESARQRFRREARAAGRLHHPNAVAVTDFGETPDGAVYIVMELLEGRSLRDIISAQSPLAPERAVSLMSQAAAAVDAAHDAGIIHRDLKPANIFVVERKNLPPVVKVLDFGIAKLAADNIEDSEAKNLTQTGVMIGTPRYMSPEQCDGEPLTPASDVYSLGVILYEMLTGEAPFNGATPLAVALQHSSKQPRPPRELVPALPYELDQLVLHALEKKPAARPASAGEFGEELRQSSRRLGWTQRLDDYGAIIGPGAGNGGGDGRAAGATIQAGRPTGALDTDAGLRAAGKVGANGAPSGDVTVLAATAEPRHATASVPPAADTARTTAGPGSTPVTRFQIELGGRRGWLDRAKRRPALIAVALAALVLLAGSVGFVASRRAGGAAAVNENANIAATPTPVPSPTPAPTPEGAANRQNSNRARRAAPPKPQPKPEKGNRVVKTLKKIFRNPF